MKITVMNDRELRTLTLPADPAGQVPVSVPTEAGEYRAAVLRARAGGWALEPPEEADFVRIGAGGVPEICAERSLPVTPGEEMTFQDLLYGFHLKSGKCIRKNTR